ncbi:MULTISPECIES: PLP-dependent aminotransferase family protein [Acinetobacter]|uniref:Aminotransferase class I/II-fold pyridoxal phosphate-dependent enzyme n=1 Tax=Acinetobacter chengduensis TaxID=2420890 RepID=A0ABX9TXP9_9GAMM|nr:MULTISPECIES: PLP-dependent aminotransferase family protein [Acinetobacter]MBI1452342.1 PLP-dependent aminotransferase family protein [Acinetobacter sp. FL51]RKG43213.1 PLP-dependent aminotransferase family protein [Acinetobacter sp. WCHAc060007]RLL23053.1 aminotransferase class I/II-fold pyridoxal phosphate-dependent enzyme [Acinetobacter chengduensis]
MTKIEWAMQQITTLIDQKILLEGSRVPSVRQFANQLDCSVSTIVEAYARLVSQGVLESRVGAGYYICKSSATHTLMAEQAIEYSREVDPLWISRQSLDAHDNMLKPGCGWLPKEWLPEQTIRKALKHVAKSENHFLLDYSTPHGHADLRRYIARKREAYDVHLNLQQILITDSATHSINLIFRNLLQAGDTIIIDDPCYFNFRALAKAHGLHCIAVPFGQHGPEIDTFKQALQFHPKLYLTNSGIHNPTGATLSIQTAFEIAKLAEQNSLMIVEDDIFAELEYFHAPRYLTLLGLKQVIQIGSFTKTLSAAVRCGYIIAQENMIDQLIDLNIATHFNTSHLNAEIIYQSVMDSSYARHIEWIKKQLQKHMTATVKQLAFLDIHPVSMPKAGIFLWCQLPAHIDAAELSKRCLASGIILAPGNSFSQAKNARQFMRFNVAQCIEKKVYDVLATCLKEQEIGQAV